ncbi:uncharacterized protein LOC131595086 [Vicia villosa]|uniref:uncharacterized protein LOC131595086 n=1 Tax=Vicia villosa TaxID=3911 RepID=UPI00273CE7BF|nr:uncharacterized protein LOC131595086 [Vicia villosa]
MIVWNVRGLNKHARCLEVGAHLRKLQVHCIALLETRVRNKNCGTIRKRLGFQWEFIDNYEHHNNGRIWLAWNPVEMKVIARDKSDQLIHSEAAEYNDMEQMMTDTSLFEHETIGPHFTWSNRQTANLICSRIDRALTNAKWFHAFPNSEIDVLSPHISDHSPLRVRQDSSVVVNKNRRRFAFLNCIAKHPDFLHIVTANWAPNQHDSPMYRLWKNLQKLQYPLKGLSWQMTEGVRNLRDSRQRLDQAHEKWAKDQQNANICLEVKNLTEDVMKYSEIEEQILKQKSKSDWINLGDGNNAYFYANLKQKNK